LADLLSARRIPFSEYLAEDFLNDNVREALKREKSALNAARDIFLAGITRQVSLFHRNERGLPEGDDALRYIQEGLTYAPASRELQNLLIQYYSAVGDFEKIKSLIKGQYVRERDRIFGEPPPSEWDTYSNFIHDSIIIGSAIALSRPLAKQADLIEASSFFKNGMEAYDLFLTKVSPSEANRPENRRLYTYLSILQSQTLNSAGGVGNMLDGANVLDKATAFYADSLPTQLISFDALNSLAISRGSTKETSSTFSLIRPPVGAAWANAAKVNVIANTGDVAASVSSCNISGAASLGEVNQYLVWICDQKKVYVQQGDDKNVLLAEAPSTLLGIDPNQISVSRQVSGEVSILITKSDTEVLSVQSVNEEAVLSTAIAEIKGQKIDFAEGNWFSSQIRWFGSSYDSSDPVIWKIVKAGSARTLYIYRLYDASITSFDIPDDVDQERPVNFVSLTDDLSRKVLPAFSIDDASYRILGLTDYTFKVRPVTGATIVSVPNNVIGFISPLDEKSFVELKLFAIRDGSAKEIPCATCNKIPIARLTGSPANREDTPIAIDWRGSEGVIAIGSDIGMEIVKIPDKEGSVESSVIRTRGPTGIPFRVSTFGQSGTVFGLSNPNELSTWRFSVH